MQLLKEGTAISLLQSENQNIKLLVTDLSVGLTVQKALEAPKIFQVAKKHGQDTVIKILCVIIKSFCDSIRVKQTLDAADILECADIIGETYTHDSIKDVIMAFKRAKTKGKIVYNVLTVPIILEIVNDGLNNKSDFIEKRELDIKSKTDGSTRTIENTIATQMERFEEKMDKKKENRELTEIKNQKKDIQKIEQFIRKNAKNLD